MLAFLFDEDTDGKLRRAVIAHAGQPKDFANRVLWIP